MTANVLTRVDNWKPWVGLCNENGLMRTRKVHESTCWLRPQPQSSRFHYNTNWTCHERPHLLVMTSTPFFRIHASFARPQTSLPAFFSIVHTSIRLRWAPHPSIPWKNLHMYCVGRRFHWCPHTSTLTSTNITKSVDWYACFVVTCQVSR